MAGSPILSGRSLNLKAIANKDHKDSPKLRPSGNVSESSGERVKELKVFYKVFEKAQENSLFSLSYSR